MSNNRLRRKPSSKSAPVRNDELASHVRRSSNLRAGVRFIIGDVPFVVTQVNAESAQVTLTGTLIGQTLRFSAMELFEGIKKGEVVPWGRPDIVPTRLPYLDYRELSGEERTRIQRKTHYVMALHRLGNVSYKNELFRKTLAALSAALGDPNPPAPTTAYDLLLEFRKHGGDPRAFARSLRLHRPRGPRNRELSDIIDAVILELHGSGKAAPTNAEIHREVNRRWRQKTQSDERRARASTSRDGVRQD